MHQYLNDEHPIVAIQPTTQKMDKKTREEVQLAGGQIHSVPCSKEHRISQCGTR